MAMDAGVFSSAEDVATVAQCLPSDDERGLLEVHFFGGASWYGFVPFECAYMCEFV